MRRTRQRDEVAVLGLGAIGGAVARALLARGHGVVVWNRTPGARVDALVAAGARPVASAGEAIRASELAILCLTGHTALDAVLASVTPDLAGRTTLVLGTGTPDDARSLAQRVTAAGGSALEAGLQAAPDDIGTDAAVLVLGGDRAAASRHREVLAALGRVHDAGADPGAAARRDLVLFGVWYDAQLAVLRALTAERRAGADPREVVDALTAQLGHVVAGVATSAASTTSVTGRKTRSPAVAATAG